MNEKDIIIIGLTVFCLSLLINIGLTPQDDIDYNNGAKCAVKYLNNEMREREPITLKREYIISDECKKTMEQINYTGGF